MNLVVLTGARGSGKTTTAREVSARIAVRLLKPFTTRKPRFDYDDEYYFLLEPPKAEDVAWQIERDSNSYGMLKTELSSESEDEVAITVFDPLHLETLRRFRGSRRSVDVVIVGLDTVDSLGQQQQRTGTDVNRVDEERELQRIRDVLKETDLRLRGDESEIVSAVQAICELLRSRGGVVEKEHLKPLLEAGTLLDPYQAENLESASYDLRVGNECWCNGDFRYLSEQDPYLRIPPYSYAIVKALEVATLPPFLTGHFDLKVSLFFSGIILSNGPQVDPGYRGDLFCMLFNGSSKEMPLQREDHFATIQFFTTTRSGEPYSGRYKLIERLNKNMPIEAATGPGGAIFSTMSKKIEAVKAEIRNEMPKDRLGLWAIAFSILVGFSGFAWFSAQDAVKASNDARDVLAELKREREWYRRENEELRKEWKSIQGWIQNNVAVPASKGVPAPQNTPSGQAAGP